MGYLGRRIGKSQTTANPQADGNTGGILDLFTNGYFQRTGNIPNFIYVQQGLTATGGVISDYSDPGPGAVYRAHIFTSSGTFSVSALGDYPATVEYLVVAGGGGGGGALQAGGGGAGGLRTNLTGHPLAGSAFPVSTSPGSYSVTIGGGGAGGPGTYPTPPGFRGVPSSFGPITSTGGGGGAQYNLPGEHPEGPGGSGGGSSGTNTALNGGAGNTPPSSPPQGNPGGASTPYYAGLFFGGGGGGAGAAGTPDNETTYPGTAGNGGAGVQVAIAGPASATTGVGALNPGPGQYQWFAGGGSAGGYNTPTVRSGGVGGGGPSSPAINNPGNPGTYATGGGGGGVTGFGPYPAGGGNGGSGIVVVRYQIGQLTATQKATGGAISFTPTTTYHVFTSSGTFSPTSDITNAEILVVAGGGGGGGSTGSPNGWGGGGGAGGLVYIPPGAPSPVRSIPQASGPYTVVVGGGGAKNKDAFPGASHQGTDTTFGTSPQPAYLITKGGGGGVTYVASPTPDRIANPGGSGGGNGHDSPNSVPSATQPSQPGNSGTYGYGYPGGTYTIPTNGGGCGGGGAGQAGFEGRGGANPTPGDGGDGYQVPTSFIPTNFGNYLGFDTPSPQYRYFAGGGAGGAHPTTPGGNTGGLGGGGNGGPAANGDGVDGVMNRGGGGGGIGGAGGNFGGAGGSGIVIIAYPS